MKLTFNEVFIRISLLIVSSLLLLACQLTANTELRPARLVILEQVPLKEVSTVPHIDQIEQIDQIILDEIKAVVRQSLNGAKIMLAKQFLVNSSWLIIESSHKQTLNNPQPLGRSYETPIKFQLLKSDGKCFIRKNGTKKLWLLKKAKCRLEP